MEDYLASVYYNPAQPASYSGPSKILKQAKADGKKINLRQIKEWLRGQETYTLHHQVQRKFPRNRVIVDGIDEQWDVDLMDMGNVSKDNNGVKYVLVAIDIFSRYTWLVPLKTKQGKEVSEAFLTIFARGRQPEKIRSDKGSEFTNKVLQTTLKDLGVIHFVTQNEVKANYAERVIKTIKGRISKYFTKQQTHHYIDHLQDFAHSYNHTYHRSIKMAPADVNTSNEADLWEEQYVRPYRPVKPARFKFALGDHVRISYLRNVFTREYHEKWTVEIFTVKHRFRRQGLPIYKLKDYRDEDVQGSFYEQELQQVDMPEVFRIEKVLKTRKVKGKKQHLVRWAGWPPQYDSWINDEELQNP